MCHVPRSADGLTVTDDVSRGFFRYYGAWILRQASSAKGELCMLRPLQYQ